MLCPNCYAYLKPRMEEVKVVSIYEKLEEFGIGKKNLLPAKVFLPCPDREKKELLGEIEQYIEGKLTPIEEVQCCGCLLYTSLRSQLLWMVYRLALEVCQILLSLPEV